MPLDHARTITQTEYDTLWDDAEESGEVVWAQVDIERRRSIPKQLGQGETREIKLQPGLEITIETSLYWRSLYLDYQFDPEDNLLSNFYLSGRNRMINPGIRFEDDREEAAGETCLCYLAGARSIEYRPAEQPLQQVTIAVDFEQLRAFGVEEERVFSPLRSLMQGKPTDLFHQSLSLTPAAVQPILRQLLDCPYHGATKRMYLEAKALELLALQFYQLTEGRRSFSMSPNLRPADIEQLQLARDILQKTFDQPPSLMALARQVGLNDYKLKQGFRHLFGTTVFGYVQTCRMALAQQLLGDLGLSIASISGRVGYVSASRFCQAFKRHTGMTPSQYRRQFSR
ncbi:MAG: AraC family transcriptional regulator [Cyanobacteria bacterium J06639_16]